MSESDSPGAKLFENAARSRASLKPMQPQQRQRSMPRQSRSRSFARLVALVVLPATCLTMTSLAAELHVGSKRFTESYILGEIVKQTANGAGEATATHSQGLGNTAI